MQFDCAISLKGGYRRR